MFENVDRNMAQISDLYPVEDNRLKQIKDYYKLRLTYSSNALEENSLTESEIKKIMEGALKIDENQKWDYYDIIGHLKAFEYIYDIAKSEVISKEHIKTMHRLLYSLVDAEVGEDQGGNYRKQRIHVIGSSYPVPVPEKIPALMLGFVNWLTHNESKLHPVEFAAQAHKELDFIHPFIDGNRRVERLLMNLCLIRKGFTIVVIPPSLRSEYTTLLEKAHTDDKPFIEFITSRVEETQREIIQLLKNY